MADPMLRLYAETETRRMLSRRPTWMLLSTFEVAEATRDDMRAHGNDLGVLAAAQLIDFIIDELDGRYPPVMARFHFLDGMGHDVDLIEMYRDAYREEIAR